MKKISEKLRHTGDKWKIMADPQHKGKHPLHENRYITTADAEFEYHSVSAENGYYKLNKGSIICSMRDQENQKADAVLISKAPEMLEHLKIMTRNFRQHLNDELKQINRMKVRIDEICPCYDELLQTEKLIREIEGG